MPNPPPLLGVSQRGRARTKDSGQQDLEQDLAQYSFHQPQCLSASPLQRLPGRQTWMGKGAQATSLRAGFTSQLPLQGPSHGVNAG